MKRVKRTSVFETNSSSVHTLSIAKEGREPSELGVDENGFIIVKLDQYFGKNKCTYHTQEEKLKYLITSLYYLAGWEVESISGLYQFSRIEEVICEYVDGAVGIVVEACDDGCYNRYFGIDHQSQPGTYNDLIIDIDDDDAIIDFVFNRYVSLATTCD